MLCYVPFLSRRLAQATLLLATLALVPSAWAATFTWSGGGATNNWSEAANWMVTSGSDADGIPDADDTLIFDGTSAKDAVLDGAFSISVLQIDGTYTGMVSLGGHTLTVRSRITITDAGSLDAGTSRVVMNLFANIDSAAPFYDFEIGIGEQLNPRIDQDLVVNNDLTLTSLKQVIGTSATVRVFGDVLVNDGNGTPGLNVVLVGSTDQAISGNGKMTNLEVAKTGGDVLLLDDLVLVGGTLSGSGLIRNAGGTLVLETNWISAFTGTVDDVNIVTGEQLNPRIDQDLVVNNDLTLTSLKQVIGTSATVRVFGDVLVNDGNGTPGLNVVLVGSTDQAISGSGKMTNLEVAKTGGDVLLLDDLVLIGGTLSGSGLIRNAGGTLVLETNWISAFTGTVDDVNIVTGEQLNPRIDQDLVVNNDLTLTSLKQVIGISATVRVAGDVVSNDGNGTPGLTVLLEGGGDQSLAGRVNTVHVGKTGGGVSGSVTGNVTVRNGGILNPGASPGELAINGNVTFDTGSTLALDLDGDSPGTGHDQLVVNGTVTINDATLTGTGGTTTQGSTITIIDNDANDAIAGVGFNGLAEGSQLIVVGSTYQVSYVGGAGNDFTLTRIIVDPSITVNPAAALYWPKDVATLNIDIENGSDFFGVSADLAYPGALTPFDDGSLAAGSFLDDGTTLTSETDDNAGQLSWAVTRAGNDGANGAGTAATMTFSVNDFATPGTVNYSLSDLDAVDAEGDALTFASNTAGSFVIGGVWPGDTDNNCTVEAADLLPIGTHFGNTGPARAAIERNWAAKAFSPWGGSSAAAEFSESFIDSDGSGDIDEADVLAIGVNFGETHDVATGCIAPAAPSGGTVAQMAVTSAPIVHALAGLHVGDRVTLDLDVTVTLEDLLGTALKLQLNSDLLEIVAIDAGTLIDDGDLMRIVQVVRTPAEAAFTRKGTDRATTGSGTLAQVTLRAKQAVPVGTPVTFDEVRVSTATGSGSVVLDASSVTVREGTATAHEQVEGLPTAFVLHGAYPNPFNPTTTLRFDLPETAEVRMLVYDLLGRQVAVRALGTLSAGASQEVRFDAMGLASGTYVYRVAAEMGSQTQFQRGRFTLLK